jgi:23S rRNA (cytidine1920-2'-O)/16S rRNA (cytidine1409-2'-O)-methyltransferase
VGRKVRLDKLLVDRGLAPSRHRARELIEAEQVLVDGVPAARAAAQVDAERDVRLRDPDPGWVGRGALKLGPALAAFGVDPSGRICADLGASTGGFTEVLLRAGAARVHAVDVGRGLLHERVASDPRVVVHDGVNARHLEALPDPVSLVVADLAFISLTKVLPAVWRILAPGGEAVVMVKPQFEVGADRLGAGGLVRSEADRRDAVDAVASAARALGFDVLGGVDAAVAGARSGNLEHFLHLAAERDGRPATRHPG